MLATFIHEVEQYVRHITGMLPCVIMAIAPILFDQYLHDYGCPT
jgi:hypothetical protein